MKDIHCHILPMVDDGAEDLDEAVEMAFLASERGTRTIIMTPHSNLPETDRKNYRGSELSDHFLALQTAVKNAGIDLELLPGAEIFGTPEVPALLQSGMLQTLADSEYLLIEFFFDEELDFIDDILSAIVEEGYHPVLAHPERYDAVQENPMIIERWFREGVVIQLNKDSILGRLGPAAERTADWILSCGLAHVVASDAHATDARTPNLAGVRTFIEENYDPVYAEILLEENPGRICRNQPMLSPT